MAYPRRFYETFCLSVAEAQAAGLPVVTSAMAALPERVAHEVDGFVVPGDPDEPEFGSCFIDAVVRLLLDNALRDRQGRAAATKATRLYDWSRIAKSWEQELESCMDSAASVPLIDDLDLLDPSLLQLKKRVQVSPDQAARWLREAWVSYGFEGTRIPGVPRHENP
jgi:hypothetical protein